MKKQKYYISISQFTLFCIAIIIMSCMPPRSRLLFSSGGNWSHDISIHADSIELVINGHFIPERHPPDIELEFNLHDPKLRINDLSKEHFIVEGSPNDIVVMNFDDSCSIDCKVYLSIGNPYIDYSNITLEGYGRYLDTAMVDIKIKNIFNEDKTIRVKIDKNDAMKKMNNYLSNVSERD